MPTTKLGTSTQEKRKVIRSSPKNSKPMIGVYTADGILAVLAAVDKSKITGDKTAQIGWAYMEAYAAYLKSDAYRAKSEKQSRISKAWRAVNGQSRDRKSNIQSL